MSVKSQAKRKKSKHQSRRPKSAAGRVGSQWNRPQPSPSVGLPGDNTSATREFAKLREGLNRLSEKAGEYCGLPPMIEGQQLVIEPTHRAYRVFQEHNAKCVEGDDTDQCKIVNHWWCSRTRTEVMLWREPDGRLEWGQVPASNHLSYDIRTMGCSIAWSVSAEAQAQIKLSELIPDHLFRGYFLTGMFVETSKRSGVTYVFRRLKPTVALRADSNGKMRVLACLCLHPVGFYADSWAGCLTPSDDVVTHLLYMRGDESYYWRKANQIPAHRPEAGL